jgi:protease secretion system membrane fusion protein
MNENPDTDFARTSRLGAWILLCGFGGFLAWAGLAPLDEGVPAPGVVSVESKRKSVEHLNGGIVEKILVRDGEQVRAGQPLVLLNETQARAALNAATSQWLLALASEARLKAERAGAAAVTFPKPLLSAAASDDAGPLMHTQEELFRSRRRALQGELAIIAESVHGLEAQLLSFDQLLRGRDTQIALFGEQLASYRKLNADGFISRNQLIETERQLAEVQTRRSEDLSNIAGVKARLAEFRMRGAQRESEYRREVETQLADSQRDAAALGERVAAQRDLHERLALLAPVAGTVVGLAVHTVGGVIKPGDRVLDIVPEGEELIVEAQLAPLYAGRVRADLPADVHFDAATLQAQRPVLTGKVAVVSADTLNDSRTGVPYYVLRVTVPGDELRKLGSLKLQPGMQATVMVKTGERTLLAYLTRPLWQRFATALAEH